MLNKQEITIVLPTWVWEDTSNKEDVMQNVLRYIQRYKGYKVLRVKDGMAICARK